MIFFDEACALIDRREQQLCQASQHCSFIAQVTPFTSDHHLVNLRNQILQGIGCPSSFV